MNYEKMIVDYKHCDGNSKIERILKKRSYDFFSKLVNNKIKEITLDEAEYYYSLLSNKEYLQSKVTSFSEFCDLCYLTKGYKIV